MFLGIDKLLIYDIISDNYSTLKTFSFFQGRCVMRIYVPNGLPIVLFIVAIATFTIGGATWFLVDDMKRHGDVENGIQIQNSAHFYQLDDEWVILKDGLRINQSANPVKLFVKTRNLRTDEELELEIKVPGYLRTIAENIVKEKIKEEIASQSSQ